MSNSNGSSPKLLPSNPDTIALGIAVEEKFLELCHLHIRMKGTEINIPASMDKDMLRWRQMRIRHKSGDYRNSDAELKSLKSIAQWTVAENCTLRGQPITSVKWKD